jgi:AraC family transcriptional regulator of adaptative response / DNA-3-methyladenine glycosylase II
MESFSAVTSTGVYCRSGCGVGTSHRSVQEEFALAASAEAAGYRACARCRPYRTSVPFIWGGPELVCRGLQMILDGALDGDTEVGLAGRLGVSARHLRRLFQIHLGVTPDQLARSRRAHFARRLLEETDLPITQVSFASGFGSVRRYNRAFQDLFGASPREVRARRRAGDRIDAGDGITLRLLYRPPLDWESMRRHLADRAIPGIVQVAGDVYRRTIEVDGEAGVIELEPGGRDSLLLRAYVPDWHGLLHLVRRARRVFNLDAALTDATAQLRRDPVCRRLLELRPGLRPPGTWNPFETGVRAIVGQQMSLTAANRITGRLVERCGEPVRGWDRLGLTHIFPTPAALANNDLRGLGLNRSRAEAVRRFAEAVHQDVVRLDRSVPLDTLVAALTSIPGVEAWTAQYIALRLGEPDAFPTDDLGLQRAVAELESPSPATPLDPDSWHPWRAFVATHLWAARTAGAARPRHRRHRTPTAHPA